MVVVLNTSVVIPFLVVVVLDSSVVIPFFVIIVRLIVVFVIEGGIGGIMDLFGITPGMIQQINKRVFLSVCVCPPCSVLLIHIRTDYT